MSGIAIDICHDQQAFEVDEDRLRRSAAAILDDAGVSSGRLSIAIVDDATIHALNQRYLAHDYATDVLSFVLEREEFRLEGEVVVERRHGCPRRGRVRLERGRRIAAVRHSRHVAPGGP